MLWLLLYLCSFLFMEFFCVSFSVYFLYFTKKKEETAKIQEIVVALGGKTCSLLVPFVTPASS